MFVTTLNYSLRLIFLITSQLAMFLVNAKNCKLGTEVVSIYGDGWKTEKNFQDNFIKVTRCVSCLCDKEKDEPMANVTNIIKATVKRMDGVYFTFKVYNHTSCMCGTKAERAKKLYGIREKKATSANNPVWINDCSEPQPTYERTADNYNPRYLLKKKCLPTCQVTNTTNRSVVIRDYSTDPKELSYEDHLSCKSAASKQSSNSKGEGKVSAHSLLEIDSKKTLYALVLLALAVLIMLIVDCNFCCRKKGFLYTATHCKAQRQEECCQTQEIMV